MRFIKTDSKSFNKALKLSKRLEFITVCPEKELNKSDLYIAIGGGVGFAISPDKELFNLFNNTGVKLCGREAVDFALTKEPGRCFVLTGSCVSTMNDGALRLLNVLRGILSLRLGIGITRSTVSRT